MVPCPPIDAQLLGDTVFWISWISWSSRVGLTAFLVSQVPPEPAVPKALPPALPVGVPPVRAIGDVTGVLLADCAWASGLALLLGNVDPAAPSGIGMTSSVTW